MESHPLFPDRRNLAKPFRASSVEHNNLLADFDPSRAPSVARLIACERGRGLVELIAEHEEPVHGATLPTAAERDKAKARIARAPALGYTAA
jgi:hypothetical protein